MTKQIFRVLLAFYQRYPTVWRLTPRGVQDAFSLACRRAGLLKSDPNWRRHAPCDDCHKLLPPIEVGRQMPPTWTCPTCRRVWHYEATTTEKRLSHLIYANQIGSWTTTPGDTRSDA